MAEPALAANELEAGCVPSCNGIYLAKSKKNSFAMKPAKTKILKKSSAAQLPVADVMQFEPLARRKLSKMAYDYISSGGADEITMRENRAAFERLRLAPKVLVDVSKLDTRIDLFGSELESPVLLAPVAYHRIYHRDGEKATARGASAAGSAFVISTYTTTAIDEIARHTQRPVWFQLYAQRDRAFTKDMVERAVASGCKTVCLTVDTPVLGCRYSQLTFSLPKGIGCVHMRGFNSATAIQAPSHKPQRGNIYVPMLDPSFSWKDLEWLRSIAKVPVLLKGILTAQDAKRAVEHGADGVIVSNHSGRNLDTLPATIDALPHVVEAIGGRIPVLLDSGIRRGTDIFAALALGAKAVLIGRPYIYGLAAGGAEGVERVVTILRDELERAMALTGRCSIAEIDSSVFYQDTGKSGC